MRRPRPQAVDAGRYRQLARLMEKNQARRRIVWVALMNRRHQLRLMRADRRKGRCWPDDPTHHVPLEAADWRALADYGRWLERQPEQGVLFREAYA